MKTSNLSKLCWSRSRRHIA